jgi:hypothetical protein
MSCGLYLLSLTLVGGRVRDMKDADHLKMLGIEVDDVRFNRQAIADHAANLATTIRGRGLQSSTFQLNLSCFGHLLVSPCLINWRKIMHQTYPTKCAYVELKCERV